MDKRKLAVVAIGGNSLIKSKQHEDVPSQLKAVQETCRHIAEMVARGWNVVVTHGNGPQVGFILRRNELAAHEMHSTPMDVIGADTQGAIGYMIAQALDNEFKRRGLVQPVAAVVTQVVVDHEDPGFKNPSKGIGGFTTEEEAKRFEAQGWVVQEDAGRGWRRLIGSPMPKRIVEQDAIKQLAQGGFVVIAVGGGGIPVVENDRGELEGTIAVIDKDRATSLLARELDADLFLVSTAVEKVAINYNKPDQQWLDRLTVAEAQRYLVEGHFLPGSMGPKVEAIIDFLAGCPQAKALITQPESIADALDEKTGTWFITG